MTLTSSLFSTQSLQAKALMVILGSLFIAVCAQITVPMYPVPVTLQTFAVLLVGYAFGARMGAITVLAYLAEGALGLPVFAKMMNGAAFVGPTAGFLVGFVGMAFLAGLASDRGIKNVFALSAIGIAISLALYIPGVAWAMSFAEMLGLETQKWGAGDFASVWKWYMSPFLIGDAVKAVLAALVVAGAWKAISNRAQ